MQKLVLIFIFIFLFSFLEAEIIQVGNGTLTNQSLPIEAFRSYSYSQQVYPATLINRAGNISSISFQYNIVSNHFLQYNGEWKVWLGHTSRQTLSTFVPIDSLILVYDGVLTNANFSGGLPGEGWLQINFTTPFYYNNEQNLLIAVDENSPGGSSTSDEFLCTAAPEVRGIVYTDININPDPANPPVPPIENFFFARNAYPNVKLEFTSTGYLPTQPVPANGATGISINTGLSWQSSASSFDLYLGTSIDDLTLLAQNLNTTEWYPYEPFQLWHTYYWQVIAHQGENTYSGPIWSFTTAGLGIGAPQNLRGYYISGRVELNWEPPQNGNPILYRIYRNGNFFAVSYNLSYQDTEVCVGQSYYYNVRAENAIGEISDPSNTVTVHIPENIPHLILEESFEECSPFSGSITQWQNLDIDLSETWNWQEIDFPGEGQTHSWISFFPLLTTPPLTIIQPHSGSAMLASLASVNPPNNDWLISPQLFLGNNPQLKFWARSHTSDYGLERLKVVISNTDTNLSHFQPLHTGNWISVPAEWTEYTLDLRNWENQFVYLAFNCVSWDALALYLDDIIITGEGGYVAINDEVISSSRFLVYPNPARGNFTVSSSDKVLFNIEIYDIRGRKLISVKQVIEFEKNKYLPELAAGIYLINLESAKGKFQRKVVILP